MKTHTKREFERAFRAVSQMDKMVMLEQYVTGCDYRIVVLDDRVISAYERIPLSVVGDGKTSIRGLLRRKQELFETTGRDTMIDMDDPRIANKLTRMELSLSSRPESGRKVFLLDNANLSGGGDSLDVTNSIHDGYRALAIQLTRDMGLRLCGVDLITKSAISEPPKKGMHWIIEVNSAPGLDHYACIGQAQNKIVEDLYLQVLRAMDTDG